MESRWGGLCLVAGLLCLTASAGLLFYNHAESDHAAKAARDVLCEVRDAVSAVEQERLPALSAVSREGTAEMAVVEIDGYGYIGYLSIPSIAVELPVMDDWDSSRLKIAPCRQFGAVASRDLVIAAHNYDRHFGRLSQLEYGDWISFTDMDGVVTVYTVADIEVLQPTEVDAVKNSIWDLTLYTCTYGGRERVVVRCAAAAPAQLTAEA